MATIETQALIPSVSIDSIIERRESMIERLKLAHATLREVDQLSENMFGGEQHRGYRLALQTYKRHEFTADGGLEELVKEIDSRAWAFLLAESGLQSFLDAAARRKWDEAIQKNDVPELTRANIEATFSTLYAARGDMFERGVVEIFRALSWSYKTNTPVMFGKRIVMRYVIDSIGLVSSSGCDKLDDLVRVFSIFDGKPEPAFPQRMYRTINDARHDRRIQSGEVLETEYLSIRVFKNGNGHITFKRPDLVDKMNAILAKHYPGALAASREAA